MNTRRTRPTVTSGGAGNKQAERTRFSVAQTADIDARLVWRPARDVGRGWTLYGPVGRWSR